jgi:NADH-quinone oxidoreductase subunit N
MNPHDLITILPFLIVIGWACVLLLLVLFIPRDRMGLMALLAAAGMVAGLAAAVQQLGMQEEGFGGMIIVDGYTAVLQILFLGVGLFAVMQSYDYIKRKGIERGEYYILLLFTLSGMMLMANAGDLIVVFLALELLSLPLYVLAGFARPNPQSEESAIKYFLLGAFASGFVVFGIALVFGATMTTSLAGIVAAAKSPSTLLLLGGGMFLVGLGFKIAAVPFHMWTPDVYQGAPSAVTAFMSVGAKAGGFAALLRVFVTAFPELASYWGPLAMWISALTMAWGNIAAIAQSNIKRMLAYSSIANAGYILIALPAAANSVVAPEAIRAALFYLIGYAFTNLGAWAVVLTLERKEGGGLEIEDYAGLGEKQPVLALAMAVFMLSFTGIPLTVGFVGKFYIFRAAINAGLIWLALVGVITTLISAYYYLRVVVVMYMKSGEPQTRSEGWLKITVLLTALGTLFFGVLPGLLLEFAGQAQFLSYIP